MTSTSCQLWLCTYLNFAVLANAYVSTLLVLCMPFECFFSIIRPHKAASFNTVKRAKITIICIILFSILYHIPHWFISGNIGRICLTNVISSNTRYGDFYYWFSEILYNILPFVLLLIMNSVIIRYEKDQNLLLVKVKVKVIKTNMLKDRSTLFCC